MRKNYTNISDTIDEMLTYFSRLYSEHDTKLQESKEKLFEVNVRLDELSRTRNVYSLNTDYRKSVFSPIPIQVEETEKEKELLAEIKKLSSERDDYEYSINEETIYLKSIDKRLKNLKQAKSSLSNMMLEFGKQEDLIRQKDLTIKEDQKKEKEREENKTLEDAEKLKKHLDNILMLEAYDDTYHSTILDKKVKKVIQDNNHKLDNVRGYIYSSPGRSKVIVDDIAGSHKNMIMVIDDQLNKLNYNFDDTIHVKEMLSNYIKLFAEKHSNINVDYHLGTFLHDPSYARYLALNKLLNIFFDNIVKHSKAKNIKFEAEEKNHNIYIRINDDGVGIPTNYMAASEWHSGLHRANEILFMLGGKYKIYNDKGTNIEFSFKYE